VDVLMVRIDFARDDGTILDEVLAAALSNWSAE